jgi:nucleotide-binding universal stress UspA family protein
MGERSTVVVGVDGSPESRGALRFALEDAARRGAAVRVVSVYVPPEYWAGAYGLSALPVIEEVVAQHEAVAQQAVDAVVADEAALADVPVEVHALPGPPARALIEQAREADLLVLGHRGRGGFASAVLGSVGLHCVLHATCPVTIVRPEREPAEAPRVLEAGEAFAPMY